jgi:hypothetical protein
MKAPMMGHTIRATMADSRLLIIKNRITPITRNPTAANIHSSSIQFYGRNRRWESKEHANPFAGTQNAPASEKLRRHGKKRGKMDFSD